MKSIVLRVLALAVGGALAASLPAQAADLADIYHRALRSDPQLREAEANKLAALEGKPQALALLLPQVNGTVGYVNDTLSQTYPFVSQGQVVPLNATTKGDTTQWAVQLRQTIFRWNQFSQLRAADLAAAQAEIDYRVAQESVILRAATGYFDVLAARDTLDAAEASREAIGRQLEQSQKRYEVGLIAITDVEEAKAANDQAIATVIASKRTLATTREKLRELTGDSFDELARPGEVMPLIAPTPASEDQWVRAALDQNLELSSSRIAADIARENVSTARGGHLPTVDLVASRSGSNVNANETVFGARQSADASINDKQISLQLTVPIYSGGATSSRIRESVYRHRAAHERLERTARSTERTTRDAYLGVISEISRVQALRQALESTRVALSATEAGYEVGTRTAVDVLLARQRLFDAQTGYARSRYNYVVNVLALEEAAGTLDESRLTRVNAWLGQSVSVK